jgi:hypothetical protein
VILRKSASGHAWAARGDFLARTAGSERSSTSEVFMAVIDGANAGRVVYLDSIATRSDGIIRMISDVE